MSEQDVLLLIVRRELRKEVAQAQRQRAAALIAAFEQVGRSGLTGAATQAQVRALLKLP